MKQLPQQVSESAGSIISGNEAEIIGVALAVIVAFLVALGKIARQEDL